MSSTSFVQASEKILIIAPHADDEALGCGGLISLANKVGAEVYVQYVTVAGFKPQRGGSYANAAKRLRETEAVVAKANLKGHDILYNDDSKLNYLDTVSLKTMADWMEIESSIAFQKIQPHHTFVLSNDHNNQDHRAVYEAALILMRSRVNRKIKSVFYAYEIPGTGQAGLKAFDPNVYVELEEEDVDFKCVLFEKYKSQVAAPLSMRNSEAIKTLAKYRGMESGYAYAEAYQLLRMTIPTTS